MILIISPSLTMKEFDDKYVNLTIPVQINMAKRIVNEINKLDINEIMNIMKINYKLAELNKLRYGKLRFDDKGSPAILSYIGTVYKNMNPSIFTNDEIEFCREHVRILSGLYGLLNPYDSIYEHRIELKTKIKVDNTRDLYEYFNKTIYENLVKYDREIVNLCSNEYSMAIKPYLTYKDKFITCTFKSYKNGNLRILATDAKAARGRMVNFIVTNKINKIEYLKEFQDLNYKFDEKLSNINEYVFVK